MRYDVSVIGLYILDILGRPVERIPDRGNVEFIDEIRLTDDLSPRMQTVAARLPKSPKEMGRLRRRLASAGIYSFRAAAVYSVLELALPVLFAGVVLSLMSGTSAWMVAAAPPILPGADHPAVPGGVSRYLLLLSGRVLQGILV